jgi:hypothetical protein
VPVGYKQRLLSWRGAACLHRLGGLAAARVTRAARMRAQLRDGCMRGDKAGCQALLQQVKANYGLLKSKLEVFMRLEAQRKQLQPACGQ